MGTLRNLLSRLRRGPILVLAGALVLFESDLQAQFLRPLVVSLAFGLMFSTFIVLFLLPAILASLHAQRGRLRGLQRIFVNPPVSADG